MTDTGPASGPDSGPDTGPDTGPNADQAAYWQSRAGQKWVTHQATLDRLFENVLAATLARAAPQPGERVLDIGCGTGASTRALAEAVGPEGHVTGIDISAPLIDLARARVTAPQANFLRADAQTQSFAPEHDLLFSRFGVMFFDDPVAAFANLRRAARPGARLAMICWGPMPDNPWFRLPFKAAVERLGRPSPLPEFAPGPTAFKDIDRVTGILRDAGWSAAEGEKVEIPLLPPQVLQEAAEFACLIGPAARTLQEKDGTEDDRSAIIEATAALLSQYRRDTDLTIPARLILYSARA